MATKLEKGGGNNLVAGPLKKRTFVAASLTDPLPLMIEARRSDICH